MGGGGWGASFLEDVYFYLSFCLMSSDAKEHNY